MMSLFDEEQIMLSFIRSERHEAAQDKVKEKAIFPELSVEEIEEVKGEV